MYADFGPGQTLELDQPSPSGVDLIYSHEHVANRFRGDIRRHPPTPAERANLYIYVSNNPVNFVDPSGLKQTCGAVVWVYTGSYCVEENVWQDAIEAAGQAYSCVEDCILDSNKQLIAFLAGAAGAGCNARNVLPIPKFLVRLCGINPGPGPNPMTCLARIKSVYPELFNLSEQEAAQFRNLANQVKRVPGQQVKQIAQKGAKGGIAVVAVMETAIAAYCYDQCGGKLTAPWTW